ncbi:MAG: hypothetical protein IJV35_00610 [Neisseriaceae bacterium]|nr:hypothetical protein [Neisseriaceae bacterium]
MKRSSTNEVKLKTVLQDSFRQPEKIIEALSKYSCQAARLDIIIANC